MTLEIDKQAMTIMGVKFDNLEDLEAVAYAASSNMIEGWKPKASNIQEMRDYIAARRKEPVLA